MILARHLRHPPRVAAAAEVTVLISIKPRYAELIERGEKRVEFRRRFPKGLSTAQAIFYVSVPARRIALVARIACVRRGSPRELWREFADVAGAERAEFDRYFAGARDGVALVLEEVVALRPAMALDDPRLRAIGFRPPQSLMVVAAESGLLELITGLETSARAISFSAGSRRAPGLRA
jgi:predicted transcriptional regulator